MTNMQRHFKKPLHIYFTLTYNHKMSYINRIFFLLILTIYLFAGKVIAQPVINSRDIKKINLIDRSSDLGASRLTRFEIVPENGIWKCYQTLQKYEGIYFTKIKKKADSRSL